MHLLPQTLKPGYGPDVEQDMLII